MSVLIETTEGDLVIDLLTEDCPKSCANFLSLCKSKYFHFSRVDKVIRDKLCHMGHRYAQSDYDKLGRKVELDSNDTKDTSAWGLVDPSRRFFIPELQTPAIAKENPNRSFRYVGTVAWITGEISGQDELVADSRFCISLSDDASSAFANYDSDMAVFGHVVEGQDDVLKKINAALLDIKGTPETPILILHTHVLEDPFEESQEYHIEGLQVPSSPDPDSTILEIIQDITNLKDDKNDKVDDDEDDVEREERVRREREAKSSALTLEIVGDLPDADVLPDSHVLFVCRLNSVTNSEDLELIFSRFGEIRSCEVIKDSISGESLQYAFIEFENKQDCERAYLKMEGAIIDDRRIHVDFSQSVANLMNKWRKKDTHNGPRKPHRNSRDNDTSYGDGSRQRDRDARKDHGRSSRSARDSHSYRDRDDDRRDRHHRGRDYDDERRSDRSSRHRDSDRDHHDRRDRERERDRDRDRGRRDRDEGYRNSDKYGRNERNRDSRSSRDSRDARDSRDSRNSRGSRGSRDFRDSRRERY